MALNNHPNDTVLTLACDRKSRFTSTPPSSAASEILQFYRDDELSGNARYACELIGQTGRLLRLPAVTVASAQLLLHRYHIAVATQSLQGDSHHDDDVEAKARAAILLGTKVEETRRRVVSLLQAFDRALQIRGGVPLAQRLLLDPSSTKFSRWKAALPVDEMRLLSRLGFMVYTPRLPHAFLFPYLRCLPQAGKLAQRAWAFLNDAFHVDVCARYPPHFLAAAAIFLAARYTRVKLPDHPFWAELFDVDRTLLLKVAEEILKIYALPRAEFTSTAQKIQRRIEVRQTEYNKRIEDEAMRQLDLIAESRNLESKTEDEK